MRQPMRAQGITGAHARGLTIGNVLAASGNVLAASFEATRPRLLLKTVPQAELQPPLSSSDLPSVIKRPLLDVVHWRPTELAGVLNGKTVEVKNRRMRIAADGVFVNGDRVADTSQMIKSLARDDIVSIRGRIDPHRLRRHVLLWTMGVAAAVLGTIAALWINHRLKLGGEEGNNVLFFIPIGAVVGVYYLGGKPQDDVLSLRGTVVGEELAFRQEKRRTADRTARSTVQERIQRRV
jgi:hypothetical protein